MPLQTNFISALDQVAIWRLEDTEFPFDPNSEHIDGGFRNLHMHRIRQRKACIHLVSILTEKPVKIWYDTYGKPHLENDTRQISFSHSKNFAAVMISDRYAGIDIELMRPKVLHIIHKFLNEKELLSLSSTYTMEHAHVYWGAKESIYKFYGKQQLLFKENILIEPFQFSNTTALFNATLVNGNDSIYFTLSYTLLDGFMLVHLVNTV